MKHLSKGHNTAVLQAFFVTFLWSTSWVIIKFALKDLPPLTFAGLRFVIAFLFLAPFSLKKENIAQIKGMNRHAWLEIILLGILYYAITPGGQNLGLSYLPANTLSLIISFTSVVVAFLGMFLLKEKPTLSQWLGLGLYLIGALVYFWNRLGNSVSLIGITIGIITMAANSLSAILGRKINKTGQIAPLLVTTLSMGIGAFLLLGVGLAVEELPALTPVHWLLTLWLALVNTAFAYQLWNKTLVVLPALDSVLINNSMLVQISILAWVFLKESLSTLQIVGLVMAMIGLIAVQFYSSKKE
ncbi:MAG: DMT family transporter [Anaerolineaceae bacterium]